MSRRVCTTLAILGAFNACVSGEVSPTLRDFSGVCQQLPEGQLQAAIGWVRKDVPWGRLEKTRGEWDQRELEKIGDFALKVQQKGGKFLPILAYNTPWSWDRTARTYEFGHEKVQMTPLSDGRFERTDFQRNARGEWKRIQSRVVGGDLHWPLDEKYVKNWENYVERVVTFLSAPPYNVRYFQIWNEAYPNSGFWHGDLNEYMQRVHLPAAKIIRKSGGRVVYGGWPCCASLKELVALLDKHHAWESIDVMDVHYFPLDALPFLRKQMDDRGREEMALWQTEIGFTRDTKFIVNSYPRFLAWGMSQNWSFIDKYKLFYFAYRSPDDEKAYGYEKCLVSGDRISGQGNGLLALADALGGGGISVYSAVESDPPLGFSLDERESSIETFQTPEGVVVAIHLIPTNDAAILTDGGDTLHLDHGNPLIKLGFPDVKLGRVRHVERISLNREVLELEHVASDKHGGVEVEIPFRDLSDLVGGDFMSRSIHFFVRLTLEREPGR